MLMRLTDVRCVEPRPRHCACARIVTLSMFGCQSNAVIVVITTQSSNHRSKTAEDCSRVCLCLYVRGTHCVGAYNTGTAVRALQWMTTPKTGHLKSTRVEPHRIAYAPCIIERLEKLLNFVKESCVNFSW